jgi:hypothetical protein
VEIRTPMHAAVLGPVIHALRVHHRVDVRFTSEYPERIRGIVPRRRFLTHAEARWQPFDLYINADPWGAAWLTRCAARVNFFHGVAGKYDLDNPAGLQLDFRRYDRVAFINEDRLRRYLDAEVIAPAQAALVGYPKLDRLVTGRCDGTAAQALGLPAGRPTALYAPTYSPASSLHQEGEAIVSSLTRAGFNVVVKLHDRSLDADPRYNGGVDWRARFRAIARTAPVRLVEKPDVCPWLAAADLLVTDHSSVGFEFLVLDRPLIVYDVPQLVQAARINPEKVTLLRSAATVVRAADELESAARLALQDRARLSSARRRVAAEVFYDPGHATERAVALIDALLRRTPGRATDRVAISIGARQEAR